MPTDTLAASPTAMTHDDHRDTDTDADVDADERRDAFSFPPSSQGSPSQPPRARRTLTPAYYPNVNASNKAQKPFSRSAAKRESVMALGSIEHLQHYFTKAGIAARQDALKQSKGLVPAIGGAHANARPSLSSIQEFHLPPSPAAPAFPRPPTHAHLPTEKTYEVDPEALKPGVIADLDAVAETWGLPPAHTDQTKDDAPPPVDVLVTLKRTTTLVRAVRNYVLSLPDANPGSTSSSAQPKFRPSSLQPVPIKRAVSGSGSSAGAGESAAAPLARIRRSALDVLTALRTLEEQARLPLEDDAYDAQSDRVSSQDSRSPEPGQEPSGSTSTSEHLSASPTPKPARPSFGHDASSFAVSLVTLPGRAEGVPVWDDPLDDFNLSDSESSEHDKERKRSDAWDARLVLAGGWLYRQDVKRGEPALEGARAAVARYLDVCDEVLFGGPGPGPAARSEFVSSSGERGWTAERMRLERLRAARRLGRERSPGPSPGASGRRVVSADVLGAMRAMAITEEPGEAVADAAGSGARVSAGAGMQRAASAEEEGEAWEEEEGSVASLDDAELPEWARRSAFVGDPLARAHALLSALLPPALLPLLPPYPNLPGTFPYPSLASPPHPADPEPESARERDHEREHARLALLTALSSGQLLCAAYNTGVRRSRKPWGYVNPDAVHDVAGLEARGGNAVGAGAGANEREKEGEGEEQAKTGWTFRRTDNLRLWAAALKLRYLVPLTAPAPLATVVRPPARSGRMSLPLSPTSARDEYNHGHGHGSARSVSPAFGRSASPAPLSASVSASVSPILASAPSPSPSPSAGPSHLDSAEAIHPPPSPMLIEFDATCVARRVPGSGWDAMLERAVLCWTQAVVEERRGA